MTSATEVLSTFGPDDGFVSEPDTGLVFASPDPLAHDMLSLAWLVESRRALPASRRSGPIDDPNSSSLAVNFGNRIVTHWLGGIGQALRTQHLTRHELDTLWDDRVLRRAFELAGGMPRVELADADGSLPAELRAKLGAELTPAARAARRRGAPSAAAAASATKNPELRRIRQQPGRLLPAGEFFSASQTMTATGKPVRSRSRCAIASSVEELAAQTPAFSGGALPIVVT